MQFSSAPLLISWFLQQCCSVPDRPAPFLQYPPPHVIRWLRRHWEFTYFHRERRLFLDIRSRDYVAKQPSIRLIFQRKRNAGACWIGITSPPEIRMNCQMEFRRRYTPRKQQNSVMALADDAMTYIKGLIDWVWNDWLWILDHPWYCINPNTKLACHLQSQCGLNKTR